jgi:hypothetical protein
MPKFIVRAGRHHQDDQTFIKGQVVDSPHDLVKAFPGKFKKIANKQDVADFQNEQEEEVVASLPRAAVVGTDLESEASQDQTGDDPEGTPPVTGEDSVHGERERAEQEEEPAPRRRPRAKKRR